MTQPSSPHADKELILFGASGDLATEKLYPALFDLFLRGESVSVTGYGRTALSLFDFQTLVKKSVLAKRHHAQEEDIERFSTHFRYVSGAYDAAGIKNLTQKEKSLFFYLAIPSDFELIKAIVSGLSANHLLSADSAIALEKPFGLDLASAQKLNHLLTEYFSENQIYRIDHYLAKDMVQDLLALRFANPIFEPVWNNHSIREIKIEIYEHEGIRKRGQYYEKSGAIRDMLQNHALQLLAFTMMDQPENLRPESIHCEKIKLFRTLRLFDNGGAENIAIGQYAGYREEAFVAPDTLVETRASLRLEIDTPRWRGVPITIATGKKMPEKTTDITIFFKKSARCLWEDADCTLAENQIKINIQPKNEITLRLNSEFSPEKKCAFPNDLRFGFTDNRFAFKDPYDNALHDFFAKDQGIFLNSEEILLSWQFIDSLLALIEPKRKELLEIY